jgi:hypothetical protein
LPAATGQAVPVPLPGTQKPRAVARAWSIAAILLAALSLVWPAFYNRFPILFPDSMTYLDDGRLVARALFLHRFSAYYGMRSFIYSLGILPFHWNLTVWPVVAVQAILVAWMLWLVVRTVRSVRPQPTVPVYLALVVLLSVFTSLSWYASLVLPDILGPVLYLSIYLLVFAGSTLEGRERWSLYLLSWWAVASHATHLMLAAGLCILLALLALFARGSRRRRLQSIGPVALVVLLAALAQLALNGYLYGRLSLNGERPPFLAARIVSDGPGRWYLERHCGEVKWVLCDHLDRLSSDPDNFLWGDDGLSQNLSESEGKRLMQEEMPFVLATVRAYPREQLARSAANFWDQLRVFGLFDLGSSSWMLDQFEPVMPAARTSYLASRQARDALPLEEFSSLQFWTVIVSLLLIAALLPHLWRRRSSPLPGLAFVIFAAVVANALVTGTLSMVEDRFQSRVIWLIPLLAGILILDWWNRPGTRSGIKA